jgi:hypothetical protein
MTFSISTVCSERSALLLLKPLGLNSKPNRIASAGLFELAENSVLSRGQKSGGCETKGRWAMKSPMGEHDRVILEAYLQDLICEARNPNQLDVLVQVLTLLQHTRTRAASNSA